MTIKRCVLSLTLTAAALAGLTARAAPAPSFDCARASSGAEQAICASDALAAQDASIASHFDEAKKAFDAAAVKALTQDQRDFVLMRGHEYDELNVKDPEARTARLSSRLQQRDAFLASLVLTPRKGFEGTWNNLTGGFTVTRRPDGRLWFDGKTTHPRDGRWLCQVSGEAKRKGDALVITPADEDGSGWTLTLTRLGAAVNVAERPPAKRVAGYWAPYCGMNGTLGGVFFPVRQP